MRGPKLPLAAAALALALLAAAASAQGNSRNGGSGPSVTVDTAAAEPRPSPGAPLEIRATVTAGGAPVTSVELVYAVGYGPETAVPMLTGGRIPPGVAGALTATIPGADAGAMVRWAVRASDARGGAARDPPFLGAEDRQYYGTVVQDPSFSAALPVVELFCADARAPFNPARSPAPGCSLLLGGAFADNVAVRRKGMSSLNWPKPKFKVDAGVQGKVLPVAGAAKPVKQINFNGEWMEPGENSFMRETLAWAALRAMGVDALPSYQTVVRLNGAYFGKFALGVDWTQDALEAAGYATTPPSPRFKSESGEYSNLRWDVPPDQLQYYYSQETDGVGGEGAAALVELGRGLAGGAPGRPRSTFLFDAVHLPKTVNYMAAMAVLLNQDRCTKNFEVYLDPGAGQWTLLPWDVEGSLGIDRGLGGRPAADYCILDCPQWNSPLYCDRNHPQDLAVRTPWGLITTRIDASDGPAGRRLLEGGGERRLAQAGAGGAGETPGTAPNGAARPGLALPADSAAPADYDADLTRRGRTPAGAPGTFNYLIDAILAVPRTRAMYVRRLRTLMDEFIAGGRLEALVIAEHQKVREEARRDVSKWGNPGDPDRGYQQLITEQLPIRRDQLYCKYGTGGDTPLIPDAQPGGVALAVGAVEAGPSGYVQVLNDNDVAVDVSGWRLEGGGVSFDFLPGTVIPPKDSLYVAAGSVVGFKARRASPRGGEGHFVVGPLRGTPDSSTGIAISPA